MRTVKAEYVDQAKELALTAIKWRLYSLDKKSCADPKCGPIFRGSAVRKDGTLATGDYRYKGEKIAPHLFFSGCFYRKFKPRCRSKVQAAYEVGTSKRTIHGYWLILLGLLLQDGILQIVPNDGSRFERNLELAELEIYLNKLYTDAVIPKLSDWGIKGFNETGDETWFIDMYNFLDYAIWDGSQYRSKIWRINFGITIE